MPNYSLSVNQIEISGCHKRMFVPFFSIDSDFLENQGYFREDTIELGFNNEAERCSEELFEELGGHEFFLDDYAGSLAEALEKASEYSFDGVLGGVRHIVGNCNYTSESDITLICMDDHHNEYTVVISMMNH